MSTRVEVNDDGGLILDIGAEQGPSGAGSTLSDDAPSALGTAAAGTGNEAARDDHVHAMPTFAQLDQVNISGVASGHVPQWNGSAWVNVTLDLADISDSGTMAAQDSDSVSVTGGTVDGTVIGGTTPAAVTTTALTISGGAAGDLTAGDGTAVTVGAGVTLASGILTGDVESVNGTTGAVSLAVGDLTDGGTMGTQDAGAVSVTGGTVDGVTIGGTTAAAGTFTDLTATGTISGIGASDTGAIAADGPASELVAHDGTAVTVGEGVGLSGGTLTGDIVQGHISGFAISNNATDSDHDLDIGAGQAADAVATKYLNGAALTKKMDTAWAAGDTAGGDFAGSGLPASGTIHIHLIEKDSDGSVDYGWNDDPDGDSTGTIPTGWTWRRRIASWLTDGSSNLIQARQDADGEVKYLTATGEDFNGDGTEADQLVGLSVPTGIKVKPVMSALLRPSAVNGRNSVKLTDGDASSVRPGVGFDVNFRTSDGASADWVYINMGYVYTTNTSGQLRMAFQGNASATLAIYTIGYREVR